MPFDRERFTRVKPGQLYVGTSGYMYDHWRDHLYPLGLAKSRWLLRYASVFSTVELNSTFYRLASPRAVDEWRTTTPAAFLFACKGSRFVTHMKKLTDPAASLERFFLPVLRLGEKLGPVLWQLPPQMNRADPLRLSTFIAHLPRNLRHVFEFRHESWHCEAIADVLDEHGCAICEHDLIAAPIPRPTGGFRYQRYHGAHSKYDGRYGEASLRGPATDLVRWQKTGRDAYVYFNNDMHGCALYDAATMSALLGTPVPFASAPIEDQAVNAAPPGQKRRGTGQPT
jgi:uncharacterized protein YecE (DUF72 family)